MKLRLVATIAAIAVVPVSTYAQQPNTPQLTKAEVQNVVQIISTDKAKTHAYCNLIKLYDQVEAAEQKNDIDTIQTLTEQSDALVANLGPESAKMIEGLEEIYLASGEDKEFMSILSGLDKLCAR